MKSKHTPGPWSPGGRCGNLQPDSCKTYLGKPYQETTRVNATNEKGHLKGVAFVYQGEGGVGSPQALAEQKANMALICAAPEMLEALQACADPKAFGSLYGGHYADAEEQAMKLVHSAIAKATGGDA